MKLVIVDGEPEAEELGVYVLTMQQFAMKEYHPFLATQEWDEVQIDFTENTPLGVIRQLIRTSKVIPRIDLEHITLRTMKLLCEICVDESAKLRHLYNTNADAFKEYVKELGALRKWWR